MSSRRSGTSGTTSAAPMRGWTPACSRRSTSSRARATPATSASRSALSSPTSVKTERLWSASVWTSSSSARADSTAASSSTAAASRPTEKFGTASSGSSIAAYSRSRGDDRRRRARGLRAGHRMRPAGARGGGDPALRGGAADRARGRARAGRAARPRQLAPQRRPRRRRRRRPHRCLHALPRRRRAAALPRARARERRPMRAGAGRDDPARGSANRGARGRALPPGARRVRAGARHAVKAYYDHRAPEYDDWYEGTGRFAERERPAWHEMVDELSRTLAALPPARTLDVACGTGYMTRFLPGEVTGLDQSARMLRIAAERLPDARFVEGD